MMQTFKRPKRWRFFQLGTAVAFCVIYELVNHTRNQSLLEGASISHFRIDLKPNSPTFQDDASGTLLATPPEPLQAANSTASLNQSTFLEAEIPRGPHVLHVAKFGLGHRLYRYASAFHLAKTLNVSYQVNWGTCDDNYAIFPYLFGPKPILEVPLSQIDEHFLASTGRSKEIMCRNDIYGYYAADAYQKTNTPISPHAFLEQLKTDEDAFAILHQRFRHELPSPPIRHDDQPVTRIGIHIRAGNGEGAHFAAANRGIDATPESYAHQLIQRLQQVLEQTVYPRNLPPPMVFVATDTPSWIPILQNELNRINISNVWTVEQERVPEGKGVSHSYQMSNCLGGWKSMMTDMLLLSQSDILIAGMRSSFTGSLPMSLVMKKGGTFCETAEDASAMTCCSSRDAWLFHRADQCTTVGAAHNSTAVVPPVTLKVARQFPDPVSDDYLQQARHFLDEEPHRTLLPFGSRKGINLKYRYMKQLGTVGQWTFSNSSTTDSTVGSDATAATTASESPVAGSSESTNLPSRQDEMLEASSGGDGSWLR